MTFHVGVRFERSIAGSSARGNGGDVLQRVIAGGCAAATSWRGAISCYVIMMLGANMAGELAGCNEIPIM